ncbi:thiamine phosphate synthase [Pseudogracilibacillus auburnensis]|uniref:thiamine phosphate synthase n=1 Tax=Pseudogracilibacillus auburnensis TaxID=1494959 RepID=UPI001A959F3D|nr:thiamine phosphate synthase [Pseudogracilibacillus auburnensis]MBO1004638.1 thiamine phosphate synthase [Pseudogracilibacillus auburnensis]
MANYLRKYFIMGSQNCNRDPEKILTEAIAAGITAFQFREKGNGSLSGEAKITLGKKLREICRHYTIPFFINDDVELASVLEVDGIHVGQDDTSVARLRVEFPNLELGLSVSNEEEFKKSPIHLVDYVGAGPIFTTSTKDDAKQAVGTEWITFLRNKHRHLPIVGIGGINEINASQVIEAGANGVAVISAITKAQNIKEVVKSL